MSGRSFLPKTRDMHTALRIRAASAPTNGFYSGVSSSRLGRCKHTRVDILSYFGTENSDAQEDLPIQPSVKLQRVPRDLRESAPFQRKLYLHTDPAPDLTLRTHVERLDATLDGKPTPRDALIGAILSDIRRLVLRVDALFMPPSHLAYVAQTLENLPISRRFTVARDKLASALRLNPFLEDRDGQLRALAAGIPSNIEARTTVAMQGSHALALDTVSSQSNNHELRQEIGLILDARYPDALFVSAADLTTALELLPQNRPWVLQHYLRTLPHHVVRTKTRWESEALAARGSSYELQHAAAVSTLQAVYELVETRYHDMLESFDVHRSFLSAAAAIGAHAEAHRHWRWLVSNKRIVPETIDAALRGAENLDALRQIWDEVVVLTKVKQKLQKERLYQVKRDFRIRLFAQQLVRLGEFEEAERVMDGVKVEDWYLHVREDLPTTIPEVLHIIERMHYLRAYHGLKDNGLDFPAIEWMLSPFSPYFAMFRDPQWR